MVENKEDIYATSSFLERGGGDFSIYPVSFSLVRSIIVLFFLHSYQIVTNTSHNSTGTLSSYIPIKSLYSSFISMLL